MIIMVYMAFFIITNVQKVQNTSASDIKNFVGKLNLTEQGPVNMQETDLFLFYTLQKQSIPNKIKLEEVRRYLNISFLQIKEDWHDYK